MSQWDYVVLWRKKGFSLSDPNYLHREAEGLLVVEGLGPPPRVLLRTRAAGQRSRDLGLNHEWCENAQLTCEDLVFVLVGLLQQLEGSRRENQSEKRRMRGMAIADLNLARGEKETSRHCARRRNVYCIHNSFILIGPSSHPPTLAWLPENVLSKTR